MKTTLFLILISVISLPLYSVDDVPDGHPLRAEISPVSSFGMRTHPILQIRRMHAGVDFRVEEGTPIYATGDGIISVVGENSGYGKHIRIQHEDGYETVYAMLSEINVQVGESVQKEDQIGRSGNTGLSQAPHLHYEIRKEGRPLNPEEYIKKGVNFVAPRN